MKCNQKLILMSLIPMCTLLTACGNITTSNSKSLIDGNHPEYNKALTDAANKANSFQGNMAQYQRDKSNETQIMDKLLTADKDHFHSEPELLEQNGYDLGDKSSDDTFAKNLLEHSGKFDFQRNAINAAHMYGKPYQNQMINHYFSYPNDFVNTKYGKLSYGQYEPKIPEFKNDSRENGKMIEAAEAKRTIFEDNVSNQNWVNMMTDKYSKNPNLFSPLDQKKFADYYQSGLRTILKNTKFTTSQINNAMKQTSFFKP